MPSFEATVDQALPPRGKLVGGLSTAGVMGGSNLQVEKHFPWPRIPSPWGANAVMGEGDQRGYQGVVPLGRLAAWGICSDLDIHPSSQYDSHHHLPGGASPPLTLPRE